MAPNRSGKSPPDIVSSEGGNETTGYVGPDITGTFLSGSNGRGDFDSGAFVETGATTTFSRNGPDQNHSQVSFDAGRVNSIYGRSGTVQPAALQALMIIKV